MGPVTRPGTVVTNHAGRRVYVDPADDRGRALVDAGGAISPDTHRLWGLVLGLLDWDVVVDVGANYGEMMATPDLGGVGDIRAFEPNQRLIPYLTATLDELPWTVSLVDRALGAVEDPAAAFSVATDWSGVSTLGPPPALVSPHHFEPDQVAVTTLDRELGPVSRKSLAVKIDVEGGELAVLAGARASMEAADVFAAVVEILHMPVETLARLAEPHDLYLFDAGSRRLELHDGRDREALGTALHSGRFYRQDALVVAGRSAGRLRDRIDQLNPPLVTAASAPESMEAEVARLRAEVTELREGLGRLAAELRAIEADAPRSSARRPPPQAP